MLSEPIAGQALTFLRSCSDSLSAAYGSRSIGRADVRAGEYLNRAWAAAWGRSPDATAAYRDAVRAVEAAAIPIVVPNDRKATLGKVIGELGTNRDRFSIRLRPQPPTDGIEVLLAMMRLLWRSQLDRHGNPDVDQPRTVTHQEAQDAVILSATLVQLFASGGVTRAGADV